ncbi:hypothetical protein L7F22_045724 [Adiantum nelumboides]|nr:hypothetical protein [Adiantum nelumboides]
MPMHTSQMLNSVVEVSHYGVIVPAENDESAAIANTLGKELENCKSGSTCGVMARIANQDVFPPLDVAAILSVPTQSTSLQSIGFHLDEKVDEPSIVLKSELSSDGVNCHCLKPCDQKSNKAHLNKFEVHLSDTCERRFVMFDQCGSKKRMIFHPSMMNEFSALLQSPLEITNCKEHTAVQRTRITGHLREILVSPLFLDNSAYFDATLPPGWQSTFSPSREEDAFQALYTTVAEVSSQDIATDCLSRENSEDLDALLWSDNEMSSEGRSSNNNVSWSDADSVSTNIGVSFSACADKKRKACVEADTDSTATSSDLRLKKVPGREIHHLGRGSGYGKEGFAVSDLSFADEESSSGSSNSLRQLQMGNFSHKRLAKKARNDKIYSTLQLLRSIIPGGESLDAALLLGEAVEYVRNLHVEIEKLEGVVLP